MCNFKCFCRYCSSECNEETHQAKLYQLCSIISWDKGIKIYSNTSNENLTLVQIPSLVTTCKASKYSTGFWGVYFSYSPKTFSVQKVFHALQERMKNYSLLIFSISFMIWKSREPDVHSCMDHFFLPDPPYFLVHHPFLFLSHLFQRRWSRVGFVSWFTTDWCNGKLEMPLFTSPAVSTLLPSLFPWLITSQLWMAFTGTIHKDSEIFLLTNKYL